MEVKDKIISLIKQHTKEEYDNIMAEPYYWINESDLERLADAIINGGIGRLTCRDCKHFIGAGDWNLCCRIKEGLCYSDTLACGKFEEKHYEKDS